MTQRLNPISKPSIGFWLLPIFVVATLAVIWRFLPWASSTFFGDDLILYVAYLDGDCATRASEIFTATCQERFRPVASGFILALMHVFGIHKSLFIDVNIALQGVIATLVFLIAFNLSRRSWLVALAIAGAVALSRFAIYNVVQVIGPVESLPLLTTLGVVYAVIRAEQSQQHTWRWGLLALFCALVALFAHERFTVVPVWLGLAFLSSSQVRQLPAKRLAVLLGGCVALPLFYIAYKTFALHSEFLIGTANTHLKLDFPLILQHAYDGVSSIFGFNRGASYLLGENVTSGWNAPFVLATTFVFLFLATTLYALRSVLAPASSLRAKLEAVRWPALLLILAAFLLTPALLTIRLEIRWLYASFIMVLLVSAWAVSAVSQTARLRIAVAVVLLCVTSVALDTAIMRSFGDLFFVYSGRFADLVKRDIVDKHPEQKGLVALLADDGECRFTLLGGAFFQAYGDAPRKVRCFNSMDATAQATLPTDTRLYMEKNQQLIDVTEPFGQMVAQAKDESTVFNFIDAFASGHINDASPVATPTGKGVLVMPWQTDLAARNSLTVVSGYSYRYDEVPVPRDAQLRFAVGQVYPSPQSARAIVRISSGDGEPVAIFSHDLVPPKAGEDIHFTFVSIPLTAYVGQQVSMSFSVESPGGDSSGHWVAFIDPRIVEMKK